MTHFIPANDDSLALFITEHYELLNSEFFNSWFPAISKPKPMFTWDNGLAPYAGEIKSSALKLSDRLLDGKERESIAKIVEIAPHMYPVKEKLKHVWDNLPTWQKLLKQYDDVIEALFVNVAYPPAQIFAHKGVDSHCYRLHLCLQNNDAFSFKIDGEEKKWEVGPQHMFRFNDGELWHGVKCAETTDFTPRIVVIFDIWKHYYDRKNS